MVDPGLTVTLQQRFVRSWLLEKVMCAENESELVASNVNSVRQRVTATSVQEIDELITEVETSRGMLHSEAARVRCEVVQYSTLTPTEDYHREPHAAPRRADAVRLRLLLLRQLDGRALPSVSATHQPSNQERMS
jgi:hypothetical protein